MNQEVQKTLQVTRERKEYFWLQISYVRFVLVNYALINRARDPYEKISVLTFEAYGPNTVWFMRLECQNKYFQHGPKSRLIRALLYTYTKNSTC